MLIHNSIQRKFIRGVIISHKNKIKAIRYQIRLLYTINGIVE
jgi:ABC-type iron transport system FetAB permease component